MATTQETIEERRRQIAERKERLRTERLQKTNELRASRGLSLILDTSDLESAEGLRRYAESAGLQPQEKKLPMKALDALSRVLNIGTATVAGATRGILDDEISLRQGIAEGVRKNLSFSDILKEDLNIKADTKAGKFGLGALGFTADVLLDPITYLTFGTGAAAKIGGKALTKGGTRAAGRMAVEAAGKKRSLNTILEMSAGKKGLDTPERVAKAVQIGAEQGISEEAVKEFAKLGKKAFDESLIRFAGKGIATAKGLENIPGVKLARRAGGTVMDTEFGRNLQQSRKALGEVFTPFFKKDPRVVELLQKSKGAQRRAVEGQMNTIRRIFKGTTKVDREEIADIVFKKRKEVLGRVEKIKGEITSTAKERFAGNEDLIKKIARFKSADSATAAKVLKPAVVKELGFKDAQDAFDVARQAAGKFDEDVLGEFAREAKAFQRGEKLTSENPKVQKVLNDLFHPEDGSEGLMKRLGKAANLEEEELFEFYLPSLFKTTNIDEFFPISSPLASVDPGFRKKFKGVDNNNRITDAFELASRGAAGVIKARLQSRTIQQAAKAFGVDDAKKAARLGYKEFKRDTIFGPVKTFLPESVHKDLTDFVSNKEHVIDKLAKASGLDYITGLWKGYMTSLFPAFHARNLTGNQFNNMLVLGANALNPKNQALALKALSAASLVNAGKKRGIRSSGMIDYANRTLKETEIVTKFGERLSLEDVVKMARKEDVIGSGAFGKFELLLDEGMNAKSILSKLNPAARQNFFLERGRAFGSLIEDQSKLMHFITRIREGYTPKAARESVEEALFNYSKLTDFERIYLRRIIPFYTFTRKNAELQLRRLAKNPGRVAGQLKAIRAANTAFSEPLTEEEKMGLPPWIEASLGFKIGEDEFGRPKFLTGFGLPVEEFWSRFSGEGGIISNVVNDTINKVSPAFKFPVERATGMDFFRGKQISELDNASDLAAMINAMPEGAAEQIKDFLDWSETSRNVYVNGEIVGREPVYSADPFKLHILRSLPTSRFQGTIGFLTSEKLEGGEKALKGLTGLRVQHIDPDQQNFFNELNEKQELMKFLERAGYIAEMKRPFSVEPELVE